MLAQLNDWRVLDAAGCPVVGGEGGPSCLLVEALDRGWPRLFVATQRSLAVGEELTVAYPDTFWAGHARAMAAQRVALRALEAGHALVA